MLHFGGVYYRSKGMIMLKWEYCSLVWMTRTFSSTEERDVLLAKGVDPSSIEEDEGQFLLQMGFLYYPGQERQSISRLGTTMNDLGRDGWELVAATEVETVLGTEKLYFKRPLEE
jgi:hypothetical protein